MEIEEVERYINMRIEIAGKEYFKQLKQNPEKKERLQGLRSEVMLLEDILRYCFGYKGFELEQIVNSLREEQ